MTPTAPFRLHGPSGWRQVIRVEPPSVPSSELNPTPQAFVWVHVTGFSGASVEQDTTGHGDWLTVCVAPCDRRLSTSFTYRIAGEDLTPSTPFRLHGPNDWREVIKVESPPTKREWYGWQILLSDSVTIPVFGVALLAHGLSQGAAQTIAISSYFLNALVPTAIHGAHNRGGIAFLDMGIRMTVPLVFALSGYVGGCHDTSGEPPITCGSSQGAAQGALLGALAASLLDVAVFAYERKRISPGRLEPSVSVAGSRFTFGLAYSY